MSEERPGKPGWLRTFIRAWHLPLLLGWVALVAAAVWLIPRRIDRVQSEDRAVEWTKKGAPGRRHIVWEPAQLYEELMAMEELRGALTGPQTPDGGATVYFTARSPAGDADIWRTRRLDGRWTEPEPVVELNTPDDDVGPAFSAGGSELYLYSNRKGGVGKFDIYVSHRAEAGWTPPENAGPQVNTPADEFDPAPTPDGLALYFASNRGAPGAETGRTGPPTLRARIQEKGPRGFDMYMARRDVAEQPWKSFRALEEINVAGWNDGAPQVSPSGSFLYFVSDRPVRKDEHDKPNLDVFRARIVGDELKVVENLGDQVNSIDHETDPVLWAEGHSLVFARNDFDATTWGLYRSNAREVFDVVEWDDSNWRAVAAIWRQALILTVMTLVVALIMWFTGGWLMEKATVARFFAVSLVLHLLVLYLLYIIPMAQEMMDKIQEVRTATASQVFGSAGNSGSGGGKEAYEKVADLKSVTQVAVPEVSRQTTESPNIPTAKDSLVPSVQISKSKTSEPTFDATPLSSQSVEVQRSTSAAAESSAASEKVQQVETTAVSGPSDNAASKSVDVSKSAAGSATSVPALPNSGGASGAPATKATATVQPKAVGGEGPAVSSTAAPTAVAKGGAASGSAPAASAAGAQATAVGSLSSASGAQESALEGATVSAARSGGAASSPTSLPQSSSGTAGGAPSAVKAASAVGAGATSSSSDTAIGKVATASASIGRASSSAPAASAAGAAATESVAVGGSSGPSDTAAKADVSAARSGGSGVAQPSLPTGGGAAEAAPAVRVSAAIGGGAPAASAAPTVSAQGNPLAGRSTAAPTAAGTAAAVADPGGGVEAAKTGERGGGAVGELKAESASVGGGRGDPTAAAPALTAGSSGSGQPTLDARRPAIGGGAATTADVPTTRPGAAPNVLGRSGPALTAAVAPIPEATGDTGSTESTAKADTSTQSGVSVTRAAALPSFDVPTGAKTDGPMRLRDDRLIVGSEASKANDLPVTASTQATRITRIPAKATAVAIAIDNIGTKALFSLRQAEVREEYIRTFGGSRETEAAVERGINWLTQHQNPDGSWSLNKYDLNCEGKHPRCPGSGTEVSVTGATAVALLPFLGAGYTHQTGKYKYTVERGINWLLENQKPNGDFFVPGNVNTWLYSHAIATIVMCEAYGISKDPKLKIPAQKAVQFLISAQNASLGGWRYQPGVQSDTSVLGWVVLAMKSAETAELIESEKLARVYEGIERFLRSVQTNDRGTGGGVFGYQNRVPSTSMTAEGMLCLQFLGKPRDDPRIQAGAAHLMRNLPRENLETSYYWYYATQAMYHMGGDHWKSWHEPLQKILIHGQVREGPLSGTWRIHDDRERAGGLIYSTAIRLLMLEVYYRHLPLYRQLEL